MVPGLSNYSITYVHGTLAISPVNLTVSGFAVANKTYDGTTAATITDDGTLVGVISGDDVELDNYNASANFASSAIGNNIAVTASGYTLYGADAGNYALTQPSTTANITAISLTITAYDETIVYGSGNIGYYYVTGLQYPDSVNSVQFSANATTSSSGNWIVGSWTITPYDATGTGLSNYTITYVSGTLTVNPLALTVSGFTVMNKNYDGTTDATITNYGTLTGVISGDTVSLVTSGVTASFDSPLAATNKTVTGSGYTITGSDSGNYTLSQPTTTANILPPSSNNNPSASVFYWADTDGEEQFDDFGNWYVYVGGGEYAQTSIVPGTGADLVFGTPSCTPSGGALGGGTSPGSGHFFSAGNVSPDCIGMMEPTNGNYNSVTLTALYSGTISVTGTEAAPASFGTAALVAEGGAFDQNSTPVSGDYADITVTGYPTITYGVEGNAFLLANLPADFYWAGGTINSDANPANLGVKSPTAVITGGTTGDNIGFDNCQAILTGGIYETLGTSLGVGAGSSLLASNASITNAIAAQGTVTNAGKLTAQGLTTNMNVDNENLMYITAPVAGGSGLILNGSTKTNAAGATANIDSNITFQNGAIYQNNGLVLVNKTSTMISGIGGGGQIQNNDVWKIGAAYVVNVPFNNTGGDVRTYIDSADDKYQAAGTVSFVNYQQSNFGTLNVAGATVSIGNGSIINGSVKSWTFVNNALPQGSILLDSQLSPSGSATLTLGAPNGGSLVIRNVTFTSDSQSLVIIQGPASNGIVISNATITLNGATNWNCGYIGTLDTTTVTNNGTFTITTNIGDCTYSGVFTNNGDLSRDDNTGATVTFSGGMNASFTSTANSTISLGAGVTAFDDNSTIAAGCIFTISPNAAVTFGGLNNTFAASATISSGATLSFTGGVTIIYPSTSFTGPGVIYIQFIATWQILLGTTLNISNLVLQADPATGFGSGDIANAPNPALVNQIKQFGVAPYLPVINITNSLDLYSFSISGILINLLPDASGCIMPTVGAQNLAMIVNSGIHIEGIATWMGGSFTLQNSSVWIGSSTGGTAAFDIQTGAAILNGKAGTGMSTITVATGGFFGYTEVNYGATIGVQIIDAGGVISLG